MIHIRHALVGSIICKVELIDFDCGENTRVARRFLAHWKNAQSAVRARPKVRVRVKACLDRARFSHLVLPNFGESLTGLRAHHNAPCMAPARIFWRTCASLVQKYHGGSAQRGGLAPLHPVPHLTGCRLGWQCPTRHLKCLICLYESVPCAA